MRCPKCAEKGIKHRVYPGMTKKTQMLCKPFYDENDVYHRHDMNRTTQSYRCSNGHSWTMSHIPRCPAEGCDFGSDPAVLSTSWDSQKSDDS